MKIEITCIEALCLVQLIEFYKLVQEPEFILLRYRIMSALNDVGFRPLNDDDILLPIKVENNV